MLKYDSNKVAKQQDKGLKTFLSVLNTIAPLKISFIRAN